VINRIGRGGFGEIYKCRDSGSGKLVAIKYMKKLKIWELKK